MATLLPNGMQQFVDGNGVPLANGTVTFYIVGTSTPKNTWQNPGQTILNANPLTLDGNGRALIYGYGAYRQVVKDSVGNLVWDQQTQDVDELIQDGQLIYAGTSTGAANTYNLTLAPPITALFAGQRFTFLAHQPNTGAVTVQVSGLAVQNLLKQSGAGPVPLAGNEIATNNIVDIEYDGSQFQLMSASASAAAANGFPWAIAGGSADAITASYTPPNSGLTDGLGLAFRAAHANATTTPTFSPDGFTAHVITKKGGAALAPGDIPGALAECLVRYNLANTRWELYNPAILGGAGSGGLAGIRNITIQNKTGTENTQVTLVGGNITLQDGLGNSSLISAFNVTLDSSVSGAGGLDTGVLAASTPYYIYAIYNGVTFAALMSLSSSSPTLPAGYTFFARVSFQVTDAAKHFLRIKQVNDLAQYIVTAASNTLTLPPIISGVQGSVSVPTWVAGALAGIVPSTAVSIRVVLLMGAVNVGNAIAAPNNAYPAAGVGAPLNVGLTLAAYAEWLLESTNVYYASNHATGSLVCQGWRDLLTC